MKKAIQIVCAAVVVVGLGSSVMAVDIETVPVGNIGNSADTRYETPGYGAVDYQYRIGKYEVTAGQYRDFLNAVAATDTYGLYNSRMNSNSQGCQITWNPGSSTYDFSGKPSGTDADWVNRPVNYVSWYDAAMFANWATSGDIHQGAYDTSAGANWGSSKAGDYTGITAHDSAAMDALVSTYGKVYVIPTEDEWYKAAYYDGSASSYYDYPTSSNSVPSNDLVESIDPGNNATFNYNAYTIGSPYYQTEVGAHENSDSPYGTFDQGGNVKEWNEAVYSFGANRGLRGGAFNSDDNPMLASTRAIDSPWWEYSAIGFRVSEVPEPATLSLLTLGGLALVRRRKRGMCK
jgi:formylglycine-generating enzyme